MSYRLTYRLAVAIERETDIAPGDRLQLRFNGNLRRGFPLPMANS
jgi:hypothetical protein